jgi:hypothetical protein
MPELPVVGSRFLCCLLMFALARVVLVKRLECSPMFVSGYYQSSALLSVLLSMNKSLCIVNSLEPNQKRTTTLCCSLSSPSECQTDNSASKDRHISPSSGRLFLLIRVVIESFLYLAISILLAAGEDVQDERLIVLQVK